MTFRRAAAVVLAGGAILLLPSLAQADITAFLGSIKSTAPLAERQSARGVAVSVTLLVVGVEFEYSNSSEDVGTATPGVSAGMVSALIRTPTGRIQVYGTLGVGVYRETLGALTNTSTAAGVGGGITVGLAGPLGVRIDYRVLALKNPMQVGEGTRQRLYAGLNFKF